MTKMKPSKMAFALVLHTTLTARQVCLAAGGDHIATDDGAERNVDILRNHSAPRKLDSITQEAARILQFRLTGQTVDGYIVEFDLQQSKAASKMRTGAGFFEAPAPSSVCRTRRFRAIG